MILSHARRFIFIKTPKTGSTSIEAALSSLCGPDDVITPILGNDIVRKPDAQNYMRGAGGEHSRERDYFNHMPLSKVMEYAGSDVRGYRKIAFVRNPWDRHVSLYHFLRFRGETTVGFAEWLLSSRPKPLFKMLALDDDFALDFVGRYETIEADLSRLCDILGCAVPPLPKINTNKRPAGDDYRAYYDARLQALVAKSCAREIAAFGYSYS